jgi:hypothetical protein
VLLQDGFALYYDTCVLTHGICGFTQNIQGCTKLTVRT